MRKLSKVLAISLIGLISSATFISCAGGDEVPAVSYDWGENNDNGRILNVTALYNKKVDSERLRKNTAETKISIVKIKSGDGFFYKSNVISSEMSLCDGNDLCDILNNTSKSLFGTKILSYYSKDEKFYLDEEFSDEITNIIDYEKSIISERFIITSSMGEWIININNN